MNYNCYDSRSMQDYVINTKTASQVALEEQNLRMEEKRNRILESRRIEADIQNQYSEFVGKIKNYLVTESLNFIYEKCLPKDISSTMKAYGKSIITNFVNENGGSNLVRKFETKSLLLAELANIVNDSFKSIVENTDPNDPNTFSIKTSDNTDFYDKLNNVSIEKETNEIVKRVAKATEDFIKSNVEDKNRMEELASMVKDKIDSVKNKDKETEDAVKNEYATLYKRAIDNIDQRKTRTIYEQMVKDTAVAVVKNQSLTKSYTTDNGKLDVDKIVESVHIMYTFLEMVNTLRVADINTTYLESALADLKR